jgi:phage terminase small subunit
VPAFRGRASRAIAAARVFTVAVENAAQHAADATAAKRRAVARLERHLAHVTEIETEVIADYCLQYHLYLEHS